MHREFSATFNPSWKLSTDFYLTVLQKFSFFFSTFQCSFSMSNASYQASDLLIFWPWPRAAHNNRNRRENVCWTFTFLTHCLFMTMWLGFCISEISHTSLHQMGRQWVLFWPFLYQDNFPYLQHCCNDSNLIHWGWSVSSLLWPPQQQLKCINFDTAWNDIFSLSPFFITKSGFITSWIQICPHLSHTLCLFNKFASSFALQPPLARHSLMRKALFRASHGIPNPVLDF